MAKKVQVALLETVDIFDFYGCEFIINHNAAERHDRAFCESRIDEIYEKYLHACRERIKAECIFLGIKVEDVGFSIKKMLESLSGMLDSALDKQAERMNRGGHFNLMDTLMTAAAASGQDMSGVNFAGAPVQEEPAQPKNTIDADSLIKDPKWHIIAKAFQDLEDAVATVDRIKAIDYLNDLQHNSFALLIDLQTGRMLEGQSEGGGHGKHGEAVDIVKQVLDIKQGATSPKEFSGKMSKDIRDIVREASRIA